MHASIISSISYTITRSIQLNTKFGSLLEYIFYKSNSNDSKNWILDQGSTR